jgi:hypothetical membrane protein
MTETGTLDHSIGYDFDTTHRNRMLAGIFLFAIGAGFLTMIMLAASVAPDYLLNPSAISDLGVISETALLFNVSLVIVGLLNLLAGVFLYRGHGRRWLLGIFAVAGLGAIGTGLFPLNTGGLHGLFALIAFVFFNLEAIGMATQVNGVMKGISVFAGVIGLVFVVIMAFGDAGNPAIFGPIGHGGTERLIVYPVMLWMVGMGGHLLADPEAGAESTDATI